MTSDNEFKHYLKSLYSRLTPTQVSADTWPPSATRTVFNLAMIKTTEVRRGKIEDQFIRQTITGKVDDILREKYPIQLKDIFNDSETEEKQTVVLLEGAPGCGKSTLSVYISQQWGEGKLFTEFEYVIYSSDYETLQFRLQAVWRIYYQVVMMKCNNKQPARSMLMAARESSSYWMGGMNCHLIFIKTQFLML